MLRGLTSTLCIGLSGCSNACGRQGAVAAPAGEDDASRCTAPLDWNEECQARIAVWAYDAESNRCHEYTYGGCPAGPQFNRFKTQRECERVCFER